MDREEVITQMTPEDIRLLPDGIREAVIAEYTQGQEAETRVAELAGERDGALSRVSELEGRLAERETVIAEFTRRAFETGVDALVAEFTDWQVGEDEAARARLEALRSLARARLVAEMGEAADLEAARVTLQSLWDGEFKVLAEMARDALAGPGALVPGADNRPDSLAAWKDQMAEKADDVRRAVGV